MSFKDQRIRPLNSTFFLCKNCVGMEFAAEYLLLIEKKETFWFVMRLLTVCEGMSDMAFLNIGNDQFLQMKE